MMTVFYYNIKM